MYNHFILSWYNLLAGATNLSEIFWKQGHVGEALDEFHQAMQAAAEQKEIALICQYEIGEKLAGYGR